MMIRNELALLDCFKKRDQKHVVLPRYVSYPIETKAYYTWSEPSGVYQYLVFQNQGWERPLGIVFQRNSSGSSTAVSGMCDWCHSYGASDEISLLTTSLDSRMTGGTYLCIDLSCLQKLETLAQLSGRDLNSLTQKLFAKIARFFEKTRHVDSKSI